MNISKEVSFTIIFAPTFLHLFSPFSPRFVFATRQESESMKEMIRRKGKLADWEIELQLYQSAKRGVEEQIDVRFF
jgi:hypothetical protein